MPKNTIIETLRANGAVAAHPLDRWVTSVKGVPQKVTLANPLYADRKKLKVGDKIAIVNIKTYSKAFICRISKLETGAISKTETVELVLVKTLELD